MRFPRRELAPPMPCIERVILDESAKAGAIQNPLKMTTNMDCGVRHNDGV